MKEIKSADLGEKYYEIDHKSGLKIFVMPKENYSSAYAIFATKYGSVDNCFRQAGCDEWTVVPQGIAHFLEHKLFESEDLDAFSRYAETGASANAYTSFEKTCYLFRCNDNFAQSLEILLDFVTHPYFTKETVEKEQGIIAQEIRMYYDVADWMSTFNLFRCLYHNHPVKIDIAGTVESISKITDKLLYKCYNAFYNLHNMCLAVVGNVDTDEVLSVCDKMLETAPTLEIERSFEPEPREIVKAYDEYNLELSVPVFAFGYKEECKNKTADIKTVIETNLLLEILAGDTSDLYIDLFGKGMINSTFSTEYFNGFGYEGIMFSGESEQAEEVADAIKLAVDKLKRTGISDEQFESARRLLYGREIMNYNDIDAIANALVSSHFEGYSMFEVIDLYKSITKSDIENRLANIMEEKYSALSVVRKKDE